MSIRLQLLIVALTTLILPWAGCQYARELENALRVSQENALESTADTIALALSAQPARVFHGAEDSRPYAEEQGDLYVFALRRAPLLDGYREDWGVAADPKHLPTPDGYGARLQLGSTDRYLFIYLEVDEPHFVAEPTNPDVDKDRFDRVDVTLEQPDGSLESYFFATAAPGLIEAQKTVIQGDGTARVANEPRIQAYWLETAGGYHLEARVPLALVGAGVCGSKRARRAAARRALPPIRLKAGACSWRRPVSASCSRPSSAQAPVPPSSTRTASSSARRARCGPPASRTIPVAPGIAAS